MSGHKPFKRLTDKMSAESKERVAALTRDANETIRLRAVRDPEFREALAEAANESDSSGDAETAQALRDYLPESERNLSVLDDTDYIRQRMREIASPPPDRIATKESDGLLREGDTKTIDGYNYALDGQHWHFQRSGKP